MSGTEISKLTAFAKKYIESAKIDENNNGKVDEGRELKRLLTGTAANSIEELTLDNIKQKIKENDTEKIFTAFMTEKGLDTVTNNPGKMRGYLGTVLSDISSTKKNLSGLHVTAVKTVFGLINDRSKDLIELIEKNPKVNSDTIKYFLEKIQEDMSTLELGVENIAFFGDELLMYEDEEQYPARKDTEGLYKCNWSQHLKFIQDLQAELKAQMQDEVDVDSCLPVLRNIIVQIEAAKNDLNEITARYNDMLDNDYKFVENLRNMQADFMADGVATDEEKAKAKDLLGGLVDHVSPWTRNLLLQQAEAAYKYDADYQRDDDNTTTGMQEVGNPANSPADTNGFKKVLMKPYGVVLMNQSTGEIKTLGGMVIKSAKE